MPSARKSRLHLRVLRGSDGHSVALFGESSGLLVTLVRGLDEADAIERAEAEAKARGIEVRP